MLLTDWLLQEILRSDPFDQFFAICFSLFIGYLSINLIFLFWLYDCMSVCPCAFLALVAFISFSLCCKLLHAIIVAKCRSLNPFFVSPLPPGDDLRSVELLPVSNSRRVLCEPLIISKNRGEDKCASFGKSFDEVHRYERLSHTYQYLPERRVPVLRFNVGLSYRKAGFGGGVSSRGRHVDSASHVKSSPVELTDEVDLLCEQFAAMHLGASAQASALVQHQDEPSSLMPAATVSDDVDMQSLEEEADADSLAYQHNTASSSAGTPFPDRDVEMEDSFYDDSNQIPSAAAGEEGPVAMDIDGDSLSMDDHDQEQRQQQESSAGLHATAAMHAAAGLALMPPAQEQPLPEEDTPMQSADDFSDSDSDSGHEEISDAGIVEDSEHEQDVGDTTAFNALASAIAANMLPSLERSNDEDEDDDDEEVRVGADELENDDEASHLPPPQTTPAPTDEDIFAEIFASDSDSDSDG